MSNNSMMNEYLASRGINPNDKDPEASMPSFKKYNYIFSEYGIYNEPTKESVCVADIVASLMGGSSSVYEELDDLFVEDSSDYHSRSNDMTKYSTDELIVALRQSYTSEPIELIKAGDDYVIGRNGRHRVNLLKANYLSEEKKCTSIEEIQALREKYTIPATVEELDRTKTYTNYILKQINKNEISLNSDFDSNYVKTGKSKLTYKGEKQILNNDELIHFTQQELINNPPQFLDIAHESVKSEDFRQFICEKYPQILENEEYQKLYNTLAANEKWNNREAEQNNKEKSEIESQER